MPTAATKIRMTASATIHHIQCLLKRGFPVSSYGQDEYTPMFIPGLPDQPAVSRSLTCFHPVIQELLT
jgi:hypothetical protein